jgi:hypothetical protein
VPDTVCMIWVGSFEKLLKMIHRLPRLAFKITLGSSNELLIGVTGVLIVVTFVVASGNRDSLGPLLWPPLVTSGTTLLTLVSCFGSPPQPLPGAAFPLLCTKMAPTTSSPEVCLVAMSSRSFVVFGWSRLSSCTRV